MILEEILDSAGVNFRLNRSKGGEVTLDCPFCIHRGLIADTHGKFGLNITNGLAHCFRCGWSSRSLLNTARCLSRAYGLSDQLTRLNVRPRADIAPVQKRSTIAVAKPIGLPAEYEVFGDADDPVEQAARQYLASRRISVLQIIRHKIGYAACGPMAWRVLFPVIGEDQRIYGCVGRAIQPDMQPKYLNTSAAKLLWNAHREGSYAVVAEGIVDALMVEQALLSTKDAVAIARLGSSVTPLQLKQLRKYSKVVVLPDWDVAGAHGALDFAKRCYEVGIQTWVAVPGEMNGLDPGSMSERQISDQLANAQPFCEQKPHTAWRLRASAVKDSALH